MTEQAINHYKHGISHDIFKEPVTTYAQLSINALEKQIPKKPVHNTIDRVCLHSFYVLLTQCFKELLIMKSS